MVEITKINFNIGIKLLSKVDGFADKYSINRTNALNLLLTKALEEWDWSDYDCNDFIDPHDVIIS